MTVDFRFDLPFFPDFRLFFFMSELTSMGRATFKVRWNPLDFMGV